MLYIKLQKGKYSYEKSDLRRKNNKNKKLSIIRFILLAILLTVPFFFITKPYGWILPVFSVVVCICQGYPYNLALTCHISLAIWQSMYFSRHTC